MKASIRDGLVTCVRHRFEPGSGVVFSGGREETVGAVFGDTFTLRGDPFELEHEAGLWNVDEIDVQPEAP